MPENPASYRVVRTKSYLFNKAQYEINCPGVGPANSGEPDARWCQPSRFSSTLRLSTRRIMA
ncbi:hypothetical protein EJ893_22230 [Klebsiella pneumoniae subsp. pneumoniae]|nr:hypothetical protein EJ882_09495 [Klebsiella pneumoniae subsp. pneumoniae]RTD70236.1 hypothetical protein EJ893_22230 [Klebsiella pneumoniae subsp. pneumoniae]